MNHPLTAMNYGTDINLDGIPEARWKDKKENRGRCAVCQQPFETIKDEDDGSEHVPLLLWRKNGKEMLSLCWPCARKRISASDVATGAE